MFKSVLSKRAQESLALLGKTNILPKKTHLKKIMAMKLAAIMDRGSKKDFIDLYFLSKKGISIDEGFKYYEKKYQAISNNLYSLIKGLSYFDDAETSDMPEMIEKVSWTEVKKFFQKEVIRLAKKYL